MWEKIEQSKGDQEYGGRIGGGGRKVAALNKMVRVDIFENCGASVLLVCQALP